MSPRCGIGAFTSSTASPSRGTARAWPARLAADGATAVREVVGSAADVVLLDIEMPSLAGVEALPTIRAVAPEAVVIMVSGTTDAETAKRAPAYGAFDYVIKPIDFEYLTRSLEAAAHRRSWMTIGRRGGPDVQQPLHSAQLTRLDDVD
jgi:DNA-binding NtrC family response regulator